MRTKNVNLQLRSIELSTNQNDQGKIYGYYPRSYSQRDHVLKHWPQRITAVYSTKNQIESYRGSNALYLTPKELSWASAVTDESLHMNTASVPRGRQASVI